MSEFNLQELLKEAEQQGRKTYGRFVQVEIMPGFWGWISGLPRDEQFFPAVPDGNAAAKVAAKKRGSTSPSVAFRLTQFAGTNIEQTDYPLDKDRVDYVNAGEFPWDLWLEHTFNGEHGVPEGHYGKPVFAHVASARHPQFDEENEETWTPRTVWWDWEKNEPRRNDEGEIRAQYYDYPRAVFTTEAELVEYAKANGVEVAASASYSFPRPAAWKDENGLTQEVWEDSVTSIVAEVQSSALPKVALVGKLLKEWNETGITKEELEKIYNTVKNEPPF